MCTRVCCNPAGWFSLLCFTSSIIFTVVVLLVMRTSLRCLIMPPTIRLCQVLSIIHHSKWLIQLQYLSDCEGLLARYNFVSWWRPEAAVMRAVCHPGQGKPSLQSTPHFSLMTYMSDWWRQHRCIQLQMDNSVPVANKSWVWKYFVLVFLKHHILCLPSPKIFLTDITLISH